MPIQIPKDSEIMNWDPEDMETYWQQSRIFDTRPVMSVQQSQQVSQAAFSEMLQRFAAQRRTNFIG